MKVDIQNQANIICIWLTKADAEDSSVQEAVNSIIERYRGRKYAIAVMKSGEDSLYDSTLSLLKSNRRKTE